MKKFFAIFILFAFIGLSNTYAQKINIDSGLVAYYPFNGNANDASGNGNNGIVNGPTLTTDRFTNPDMAYYFAGNDMNNIMISPFIPPQLTSVSIWFNPIDNGSGGNQRSVLFSNQQMFVNHDAMSVFMADGIIHFGFINTAGVGFEILSNSPISLNQWHFIVCILDNNKNMKMFLDTISQNQTITWSGTYNGQNVTNIGNCYQDNDSFDGSLDDVRIYNRALSESEIQTLYNEGGWLSIPSSISSDFNIEIYPNPTSEKVYIKSDKTLHIKVYNMLGEQIITGTNKDLSFVTLNQKGIYLFELSSNKNTIYKKVVVQ